MGDMTADYLVDILRIDLAHMGCTRVALLGSGQLMSEPAVKVGLARWGVQVMVPPEQERAWIASLAAVSTDALPSDDVARLSALLADGLEHGVEAVVVVGTGLARWVRACELSVPVLIADARGSIVPIRNIVFDMGGVLFRWEPLAMARRVCADEEDAKLLARVVFGSSIWVSQDAGAIDDATVAWTAKAQLPRRLHAMVDELVYHWHDHRVPIAGAAELIGDLKRAGHRIYLLSNAGESFARYETRLPGYEFFDGVVVSYREHVVKPDARIYHRLLERYGLVAGECLFIDDTPLNVVGARRVGMRGWHFDADMSGVRELLLG